MKLSKIILMSSFVALGMTSCVSEDLSSEETNKGSGKLTLGVEMLVPSATRAETYTEAPEEFPLEITQGETSIKKYTSWKLFPQTGLSMAPGNYTATSHSYGTLKRRMEEPYYVGASSFEIIDQLTTEVDVVCKMANGKITLNFGDNFSQKFTSWTLTVDDGEDGALEFTSADNKSGDYIYWRYAENVSELRVNFRGTTSDGVEVSTTQILKKSISESEHYDDDNEYFQGGDCLVLNMNPKATTEGQIIGITLNVDISFADGENDQNVTIDVFGEKQQDGGETENHITVTKPENMKVTAETPISAGDTKIEATTGIKSIKVKIESDSEEMINALKLVNENNPLDFLNEGVEVVGNEDLVNFINNLLDEDVTPMEILQEGSTEYNFPIGNFFGFLIMDGTHTFNLTIEDMDGCKATGNLVLVIDNANNGIIVPETTPMVYTSNPPTGSEDEITLKLPQNQTITASTPIDAGDTEIAASTGIKSIKVKIDSDSEDMISALKLVNENNPLDFLNEGVEVVGNEDLVNFINGLLDEDVTPMEVLKEGTQNYIFKIGNFFSFLIMSGNHTFMLEVTDMKGNTKNGSLTLTVE